MDAVVTDPPAGISFMGKSWDRDKGGRDNWIAWMEQVARECLRLIRPGGHALVWALPRTSHWTAMAWENTGWEVRDRIAYCFGSGFPKALDVSKAIDAMAGAERDEEVVMCFPETTSGIPGIRRKEHETTSMSGKLGITGKQECGIGDSGSASRFFQCCPFEEEDFEATRLFYAAKAGKSDRNEGCEELEEREGGIKNTSGRGFSESDPMRPVLNRNIHPTVKSLSLMRYLCKLITPPGGTVLDCFLGSGSTGKAARLEGFDFIGIEQDADYFEIAKKRIEHADRKARGIVREPVPGGGVQVGLFGEGDPHEIPRQNLPLLRLRA